MVLVLTPKTANVPAHTPALLLPIPNAGPKVHHGGVVLDAVADLHHPVSLEGHHSGLHILVFINPGTF